MRLFFRSIGVLALVLCTASCSAAGATPEEILKETQALVAGLSAALAAMQSANAKLIPAATAARIQTDLSAAASIAGALSASSLASSGAVSVQAVENYINDIVGLLAGPPINGLIPPPANEALAAATVILPALDAFVNQYLPSTGTALTAPASARAILHAGAPEIETVDQAIAVLRQISGRS